MIQEYLLQEIAEKDAIKAYKPKDIKKRMFSADNEQCWYVQFSVEGDNEETAKQLSEVDEYMLGSFHVTVLESSCSAYFNKRLFPLVNGFENKLRKLLYLTSAINHDDKSAGNIANLESQDFGQVFSLLFIDTAFMGKVKDEVKNRNRDYFSKADVIAAIESIDENTLWDALLGKDSVPTLRRRFSDVRIYRNDVMHSHLIGWKKFNEIQHLYQSVNHELNKAIHDIEVKESKAPSNPTFNQTLEGALRTQEQLSAIADSVKLRAEDFPQLSNIYILNSELAEALQRVNETIPDNAVLSELQRALNQVNQTTIKALQPNAALLELQKQATNTEKLRFNISPAMQKIQETAQQATKFRTGLPEKLRLQRSFSSIKPKSEETNVTMLEEDIDPTKEDSNDGGNIDGKDENGNA